MITWPQRFFISGTDTDVGKTLASTILVRGLRADYWKPVQAGTEPATDSQFVATFADQTFSTIWPERHVLKTPASPHFAAEIEGKSLKISDFECPASRNKHMIIEGAGGVLVPLNREEMIIDLIKKMKIPVVLVARTALGTLNHTLLSLEALRTRNIPIFGVILNGDHHPSNEKTISEMGQVTILGRIPKLASISKESMDLCFSKSFGL